MSLFERTLDMFEDSSESASIKQDFILLFASTEKVRRGVYAKVGELKKENERLRAEIEEIKKLLNMEKKNEKDCDDDMPLLKLLECK
jgi:hypothetical protein